jgi:hypothetical protein
MSVEPIEIFSGVGYSCTQIPEGIVNKTLNKPKEYPLRSAFSTISDPGTRQNEYGYAVDVMHYQRTPVVVDTPELTSFINRKQQNYTTAVDPIAVIQMKNTTAIAQEQLAENQQDAYDAIGYNPSEDIEYMLGQGGVAISKLSGRTVRKPMLNQNNTQTRNIGTQSKSTIGGDGINIGLWANVVAETPPSISTDVTVKPTDSASQQAQEIANETVGIIIQPTSLGGGQTSAVDTGYGTSIGGAVPDPSIQINESSAFNTYLRNKKITRAKYLSLPQDDQDKIRHTFNKIHPGSHPF